MEAVYHEDPEQAKVLAAAVWNRRMQTAVVSSMWKSQSTIDVGPVLTVTRTLSGGVGWTTVAGQRLVGE